MVPVRPRLYTRIPVSMGWARMGMNCALALLMSLASAMVAAADFSGSATRGNLSVWRINQDSGQVSLCSFEGKNNAPSCYPWSGIGKAGSYKVIGGDDVLSTWRINTDNGVVSMCEYDDVSAPPRCTPWGE